ncbi:hypothetical protein [Streptomyces sp. NPDC060198]|uniref:hypothetical protein n=1 Tax=Streptomyces sp. NPDC060198 TaxID=3347070 RepID=UPI00364B4499
MASTENARAPFLVNYTASTSNSSSDPGGGELVWVTTPSLIFRAGRAYEVTVKGLLAPTATASEGQVRVRKTGIGGQLLYDSFRFPTSQIGNYGFIFSNIFIVGGANVTAALASTVARASGAALYSISATTTSVAYLKITDEGPAADFTGATVLT